MAHVQKGILAPPPEWWKHLRPFNKRRVWRNERRAAKEQIAEETEIDRRTKDDSHQDSQEEQGQAAVACSSAHGRLL